MKLYEIVKENGVSVFHESATFKELEDGFLNAYRFNNHTESVDIFIVDIDTLKRKRKVKSFPKLENPDNFLKELVYKKYPDANVHIAHTPADILTFFTELLGPLKEEEKE